MKEPFKPGRIVSSPHRAVWGEKGCEFALPPKWLTLMKTRTWCRLPLWLRVRLYLFKRRLGK